MFLTTRTFRDVAIPVVSAVHLTGMAMPAQAEPALQMLPVRFDESQFVQDPGAAEHLLYASQLRMLSERIPAVACLQHLEPDTAERLKTATRLFDRYLDGLEHGNWRLGLKTAETNNDVLVTLSRLREVWARMQPAVTRARTGISTADDIRDMVRQGDQLERIASRLSVTMMAVYSNPVMLLKRDAITLELVGRLPMQAQRMAQSVCLIQTAIDGPVARSELDETAYWFDQILDALRVGRMDIGLTPTADPVILDALAVAQTDWATLQPVFNDLGPPNRLSPDAVSLLIRTLSDLTTQLDEIALLYAKASKLHL